MSTQNVPQDRPTIEEETARLIASSREENTFDLRTSSLNPLKDSHGLPGIQEAVPVALRRIGVLTAALSAPELSHPCLCREEDIKETVLCELADLEAILMLIQQEAETLASEKRSRPTTKAA